MKSDRLFKKKLMILCISGACKAMDDVPRDPIGIWPLKYVIAKMCAQEKHGMPNGEVRLEQELLHCQAEQAALQTKRLAHVSGFEQRNDPDIEKKMDAILLKIQAIQVVLRQSNAFSDSVPTSSS